MLIQPPQILVVDLNNFARYPTAAVGYLIGEMRNHGIDVDLFSPLSVGVQGVVREAPVRPWSLIDERLRYRSATSGSKVVQSFRRRLATRRLPTTRANAARVIEHLEARLEKRPDVILVSAYLMYYDLCVEICDVARKHGIPVLLGGAYFNQSSVAKSWVGMSGLTALIGGEAEPIIVQLVESVISGKSLVGLPGVWLPNEAAPPPARPLKDLDRLVFPDYSDFPWNLYPDRIVPMITGRGCGWGACTFCSDVTSSMGRTYRSRSPSNVLDEIEFQANQCSASKFMFVDLKLNSDLTVWNGLIEGMQTRVPGAEWAASVHVGTESENGLSLERLRRARRAGLVRVTTGFESGSQRVLDRMKKGTDVSRTSRFLHDADAADISVRMTMMVGYPAESAADLLETADFLARHTHLIERVSLNRLAVIAGTVLERQLAAQPAKYPDLVDLTTDVRMAAVRHRNLAVDAPGYRQAVDRVLAAVHKINRRPLREGARAFDGVM